MILFAFGEYRNLSRELLALPFIAKGRFRILQNAFQEISIKVETDINKQYCLILAPLFPCRRLLELTLLAHTLKKDGAQRIVAIIPFLSYSDQDKHEPGLSLGASWLGSLLYAAEIDEVVTFEVPSLEATEIFPIPLVNISLAPIFANTILGSNFRYASLLPVDKLALLLARAIKRIASLPQPLVSFSWKITEDESKPLIRGQIQKEVMIIANLPPKENEIISLVKELKAQEATTISLILSHAIPKPDWLKLLRRGINEIFITDTLASDEKLPRKIKKLSIAPAIKQYLESLHAQKES